MKTATEYYDDIFKLYNQGFTINQIFQNVPAPIKVIENLVAEWNVNKAIKEKVNSNSAGTNFALITTNQEVIEAYYRMIMPNKR
jgi:hypothetical protein